MNREVPKQPAEEESGINKSEEGQRPEVTVEQIKELKDAIVSLISRDPEKIFKGNFDNIYELSDNQTLGLNVWINKEGEIEIFDVDVLTNVESGDYGYVYSYMDGVFTRARFEDNRVPGSMESAYVLERSDSGLDIDKLSKQTIVSQKQARGILALLKSVLADK